LGNFQPNIYSKYHTYIPMCIAIVNLDL